LTRNVITLDPKDARDNFMDIAYNHVGLGFTPYSLLISSGVRADFDECNGPPHPIEPQILDKLRVYFKSSFSSVRIHEGCNLNGDVIPGSRAAITFGEHIYFAPGAYRPWDKDEEGFPLLAHELAHVLQYRKKGFADFTFEYGVKCAFGAYRSCAIEQQAEKFQALVFEDLHRFGYMVEVHTCDIKNAGTNSTINMLLDVQGTDGWAWRLGPWEQALTNYDDHERNRWDTYFFPETTAISSMSSLTLTSDGKGDKPGWCWDRHYVTRIEDGEPVRSWAWELAGGSEWIYGGIYDWYAPVEIAPRLDQQFRVLN
jgi:Domain of unknown function (DUF4157)